MKARRVEVEGPLHLVRTLAAWGEQGARAAQTWGQEVPPEKVTRASLSG
jgi:hypothetical protein